MCGSPWTLSSMSSALVSPREAWHGNTHTAVNRGNCRAHLVDFLSLRDHCPSLPDVQHLANCFFIHIVHFLSCFSQEGISACLLLQLCRKQKSTNAHLTETLGPPSCMQCTVCTPHMSWPSRQGICT